MSHVSSSLRSSLTPVVECKGEFAEVRSYAGYCEVEADKQCGSVAQSTRALVLCLRHLRLFFGGLLSETPHKRRHGRLSGVEPLTTPARFRGKVHGT
jgi:hypothetical protein